MTPHARHPARRTLLAALAAAPLARPATAQPRPLKIGMVTSLTGPFAALGESMRAGMQLLLDQSGNTLAGRPVTFTVEDDAARPDEAVRKTRKLLGGDRVDILCGVISSGVALAVRDVIADARVPAFLLGSANELARQAASPFIVRPTKTSWMLGSTAGRWTFERVSKGRAITVASDYAGGREFVGDFVGTFQPMGGTVGRQLWTALGTADFSPLLTTIAAEKPEVVYGFFAGSDAVRFLRQWKEYRLAGRIPLVGPGAFFDQQDVLPATSDAALGAFNTFQQSPTAPAAAAFNAAFAAAGKPLPGEFATTGYVCGQVIRAALERANGDVTDWDRTKAALFDRPVDTAFGPVPFDPRNGQAILDIYVNEIRRGPDGKMLNTVVHTFPAMRDPGPTA